MVSGDAFAARTTDEAGNERMEEKIECRSGIIYKGEIGSLRRGLNTGRRMVEVGLVPRAFRAYYGGRIGEPGTFNEVSQPT